MSIFFLVRGSPGFWLTADFGLILVFRNFVYPKPEP